GPDEGREVPLDRVVEIGADPACQLVLHDPAVSRRHASISYVAGRLVVRDLGSRNGTLFGGARIKDAQVPLGAVLSLGKTTIALQPRWYMREVAPSSAHHFGELVGDSLAMRE